MAEAASFQEIDTAAALRRLNLNLLYSLDAILTAPSLTEAGRRVHLTQPAMSAALRRLREHFEDQLVTGSGRDRNLTRLGGLLKPRVRQLIRNAAAVFEFRLDFDPATTDRVVTVALPEELEILLLGLLVPSVATQARGIELRAKRMAPQSIAGSFEEGADLVLTRAEFADPAFETLPLLSDQLSCLIWEAHPTFGSTITKRQFLESRHAALVNDMLETLQSGTARRLLRERHVAARASSHLALATCLIETDLIATGSVWMFQYFASMLPVRLVPLPFDSAPMGIVAQWPLQRSQDPVIRWLMAQLVGLLPRPL